MRRYAVTAVCAAALAASACGSTEALPTGASADPGAASREAEAADGLSIAIVPNPVPWSSDAVENCDLANRWRYEQVLTNNGNGALTIVERIDFFDGVEVRRATLDIELEPGETTTIPTAWCSANSVEHRAQTNFIAVDESGARISFRGAGVRLERK